MIWQAILSRSGGGGLAIDNSSHCVLLSALTYALSSTPFTTHHNTRNTYHNTGTCTGTDNATDNTSDNSNNFNRQTLSLPSVDLMYQALTPKLAQDGIHSERLEMLGDALLKVNRSRSQGLMRGGFRVYISILVHWWCLVSCRVVH